MVLVKHTYSLTLCPLRSYVVSHCQLIKSKEAPLLDCFYGIQGISLSPAPIIFPHEITSLTAFLCTPTAVPLLLVVPAQNQASRLLPIKVKAELSQTVKDATNLKIQWTVPEIYYHEENFVYE